MGDETGGSEQGGSNVETEGGEPALRLNADTCASMFNALGHAIRLRIVRAIYEHENDGIDAPTLSERVDVPPNKVHYHLRKLADAGVIDQTCPEKRASHDPEAYYWLTEEALLLLRADLCRQFEREEWEITGVHTGQDVPLPVPDSDVDVCVAGGQEGNSIENEENT